MGHQFSQASLEKLMPHFFMARCAKWHFLMRLSIFRPASDNASHALEKLLWKH
jgi:hypothetical protein